jgi:hypothetical protein
MKAAASAGAVAHASKVLDRRPDFIWFWFVVIASLSPCLNLTDRRIMKETG